MTGAHDLRYRSRLLAYAELTDADRVAIDALLDQRQRVVASRRDVVAEGEVPRFVHFVLDGWGCRYRQLPDGRRQMLSLLLPGDLFDPHLQVIGRMDHGVGAITTMTVAEVVPEQLSALSQARSAVAQALWWNDHVAMGTHREWIASLGLRTARERIALLFCEVYFRLRLVGRCHGTSCEFPLTQADLAEATGLTPVHVNRMVQDLRRDGLIAWEARTLTILDLDRLCAMAIFTPAYLHLDRTVASG
ncbi:Crp/Fnr family transcriptional regulator [Sphingomonas sp. 2R-10]|uniref:Crp/Fnr family transcriptional regulator n=1 Tax=Sphingomonas sp. 2R-10 TaxID=3045148 RepID=UPI000F79F92B|nr:Crp/Fnr family transcriptional regulator [Sphingomonas sp. 2R-10]MDJ0276960.1 Crp/Fnr family transcriptional regulator [Sphingomonas sp. 2R-10]